MLTLEFEEIHPAVGDGTHPEVIEPEDGSDEEMETLGEVGVGGGDFQTAILEAHAASGDGALDEDLLATRVFDFNPQIAEVVEGVAVVMEEELPAGGFKEDADPIVERIQEGRAENLRAALVAGADALAQPGGVFTG
jgi:hypothetical protein